MATPITIINGACEVLLYRELFDRNECARLMACLQSEIEWRSESITMFGKKVPQPRLTAFYGDLEKTYRYSGLTMRPMAWTDALLEIKNRIEPLAQSTFTSVLLNHYRSGQDSMGWHRDNEKALGPHPVIGSVSFGATRAFKLRLHADKTRELSVDLESGSFLLMRGATQTVWEHALPKTKTVQAARINLTFRTIIS